MALLGAVKNVINGHAWEYFEEDLWKPYFYLVWLMDFVVGMNLEEAIIL